MHVWPMCKHSEPHCKTVDVTGTDVLQSCHRHTERKQRNRESNGHRFFTLTPYRFLLSLPCCCPSHSAATDLTDREELCLSHNIGREKLVRDKKSVSTCASARNLWLVQFTPSQHVCFLVTIIIMPHGDVMITHSLTVLNHCSYWANSKHAHTIHCIIFIQCYYW